jgi:superfamily I DNA/RNA helicase
MTDQISPKFHAEIIVVLCDEYQDLRKVAERVRILLSDASAEHIDAVGSYLPIDLMRVLPARMLRAA